MVRLAIDSQYEWRLDDAAEPHLLHITTPAKRTLLLRNYPLRLSLMHVVPMSYVFKRDPHSLAQLDSLSKTYPALHYLWVEWNEDPKTTHRNVFDPVTQTFVVVPYHPQYMIDSLIALHIDLLLCCLKHDDVEREKENYAQKIITVEKDVEEIEENVEEIEEIVNSPK